MGAPSLPFLQGDSPINWGPRLMAPRRRERARSGPRPREKSQVAISSSDSGRATGFHLNTGFEGAESEGQGEGREWRREKAFLVQGLGLCQHGERFFFVLCFDSVG